MYRYYHHIHFSIAYFWNIWIFMIEYFIESDNACNGLFKQSMVIFSICSN